MEIGTDGGVLVEIAYRAFFRWPRGPGGRCYTTGQRLRLPRALALRLAFPPDGSRGCLKIVTENEMTGLADVADQAVEKK